MKINVLEYLQETVANFPSKVAVIDGERTISFKELNEKAKSLATYIAQAGVIRKPVAVYLPKSIESIVSDIAITYSGNAYMNLDVKNPIERITNIHNLIRPQFVITSSKYVSKLQEIEGINIVNLDEFDFSKVADEDKL